MNWIVESPVFRDYKLPDAARRAGHNVVEWDDAWWQRRDRAPGFGAREPTVFHGSLANAARLAEGFRPNKHAWVPSAYCNVRNLSCWSLHAFLGLNHLKGEWLNEGGRVTTADNLVADRNLLPPRVFVRPSSPLKEFSGRVLDRDKITLATLDHGFYYEDRFLDVLAAPAREVGREWRYVVADRVVVAGSAYQAEGRDALPDDPTGEPWRYAQRLATTLQPPDPVYVLDVCECEGRLWLLEWGAFSGSDLYACDPDAVVAAVAAVASAEAMRSGINAIRGR